MAISISTEFHLSKREGLKDFHHFSPEGFSEEIWVSFEGDEAGKELYDEICEIVFSAVFEDKADHEPVERFEEALKKLNEEILEEAVLPNDFLQKNSFFIGLLQGKNLHFTVVGKSEVYLMRSGKSMCISEGIAPRGLDDDLFINIATGELQNGDTLLISSFRALRFVSMGQLSEILKNTPKEAIDTLQDFIPDNESGVYAVLRTEGDPTLPFETERIASSRIRLHWGAGESVIEKAQEFFRKISGNPKREVLVVGAVAVGLLLIWSLFSFLSGKAPSANPEEMNNLILQLESQLGTAEKAKEEGRPAEAIQMLSEIESKANELFDSGLYRFKASEILGKVTEIRDGISATQRIGGDTVAVNLSAHQESVSALGIFEFESEMYAYSRDTLFRILLDQVENSIEFLNSEAVKTGVPFEKIGKIIFLSESGKILEWKSGSTPTFSKTEDEDSWKKAIDIGVYNTSLYLLSPEENDIFKYTWQAGKFSKSSRYNQDGALQEAISMTIDGSVFVLTKSGNVIKLLRGKTQPFELKNVPPEFHDVTKIFTLPDSDSLIFISPVQKRIFIFNKGEKEATFTRQIVLESKNVGTISGIWLRVDDNTIYVTDEKRVHKVSLTK